MKTLRFYKILVIALILVNLITVYLFWTSSERHGPPGKNDLVEMLDLTGTEKSVILKMQESHFADKHALISIGRELHEQLFQSFSDPSKDSASIALLIDKIVENQRKTEQMTFDYFKSVNELCTPEQQKKLQKLIHDVLGKAGGPPPPKK